MKKIEICFSPNLLNLYNLAGKTVVIVDILRATSCMVAGLGSGVSSIVAVANLDECLALRAEGFVCAGERNGHRVEGFDLGNSPFEYMTTQVQGRKIAMTTTNGTQALVLSQSASQIVIGSFLNLSFLAHYLQKQPNDIVIVCAGWKGKFCIEDTLFAGALADKLSEVSDSEDDSVLAAKDLYETARPNLYEYLLQSSHYKRLSHLEGGKDVEFCIAMDKFDIVPILQGREIIVA
jgi:2-phosphosulfolactate phosphatase